MLFVRLSQFLIIVTTQLTFYLFTIQVGLSRDRGLFGGVSIQWQAKLSPGDTPATAEEISILSNQLVETSGLAVFVAGEATTNFTLSLKQDTDPELMEIFYLRLLADTIQPVAVLDTSRDVAMVTSLQSDFPYGAIQFGPDSRWLLLLHLLAYV